MELTLRKGGKELVAKIDCTNGPRALDNGGTGWFEVREIQWIHNWKLRAQVAIVMGEGQDLKGPEVKGRPQARSYCSDQGQVCLITEAEIVEVVWDLPEPRSARSFDKAVRWIPKDSRTGLERQRCSPFFISAVRWWASPG